jgi:hypothetical protein
LTIAWQRQKAEGILNTAMEIRFSAWPTIPSLSR